MSERLLTLSSECFGNVVEHLVVAGGCAHRLFQHHSLAGDPGFECLTTEDVDLAASLVLVARKDRELLDRLEKAGFHEDVAGADLSAHKYPHGEQPGAYLQFIAPLSGSGIRRDGGHNAQLRFSGVVAEKLRHVDVLLHQPWEHALATPTGTVTLRVVNPVAYVLQKLLILRDRRGKRGKDLLYLHDTLMIFGANLDDLAERSTDWSPAPTSKRRKLVVRNLEEYCCMESDVSRDAADIAAVQRRRPPDSAQIVAACELGLKRILGRWLNDG